MAYDTVMVVLRLAVVWMIVQRRSRLLRWGWIGFAFLNAAINMAYLVAHGDAGALRWLVIATYCGLTLSSAIALLVPSSARWFRVTGGEPHAVPAQPVSAGRP